MPAYYLYQYSVCLYIYIWEIFSSQLSLSVLYINEVDQWYMCSTDFEAMATKPPPRQTTQQQQQSSRQSEREQQKSSKKQAGRAHKQRTRSRAAEVSWCTQTEDKKQRAKFFSVPLVVVVLWLAVEKTSDDARHQSYMRRRRCNSLAP